MIKIRYFFYRSIGAMSLCDLQMSSRIVGLKMREILSQLPEQDIMIYRNVNHLYFLV